MNNAVLVSGIKRRDWVIYRHVSVLSQMKKNHFRHILFLKYLFIWLYWVLVVACGIQFPDQGSNLGSLHWEHGVLATRPPGKSQSMERFWRALSLQTALTWRGAREGLWRPSSSSFLWRPLNGKGLDCHGESTGLGVPRFLRVQACLYY